MSRITLGCREDGSFGFVTTDDGVSVTAHLPPGTRVVISNLPARLGLGESAMATIVQGCRQKMIRFDRQSSTQDFFLASVGADVLIEVISTSAAVAA